MSSEFQRIVNQLYKLQEQIFRNQLPSLLIKFNQQEDIPTAIEQLITGMLPVFKSQLIYTLAQKIETAKEENNKLKLQTEQLKKLIKNQQIELTVIRSEIQQIMREKSCLEMELGNLKNQQLSLAQIMKTSSVQQRVREILGEGLALKNLVQDKELELDKKNGQIQQFKAKLVFYQQEIKALSNDNMLFHKDLAEANKKIKQLTEHIGLLNEKEQCSKAGMDKMTESFRKQMNELRLSHSNQRQSLQQAQILFDRKNQECQLLTEIMEKDKARYLRLQQQVVYLRDSLEVINNQIIQIRQDKREAEFRLMQAQKQNITIKKDIQKSMSEQHQQIAELSAKLLSKQSQLAQIQLLLIEEKRAHQQKYENINRQFQEYRNTSNNQKIEQENIHLEALYEVRKQTQKINQALQNVGKENQNLKVQLKVEKERGDEYMIYLEQNNQLKAELQRVVSFKNGYNSSNRLAEFNKFLFQIMETSEIVNKLKHQNIQLRSLVFKTIEATRKWMNKEVNKLICFVMEKKAECETCNHWQKYEANKRLISQAESKSKNIKSTRDLHQLNQKFKLIREQNEIFSHRIQQIIED